MRPLLRTVLAASQRPMIPKHQQPMLCLRAAWPKKHARFLTSGSPPTPPGSSSDATKPPKDTPAGESDTPSSSQSSSTSSSSSSSSASSPPPPSSAASAAARAKFDAAITNLPSELERRRSELSKRFSHSMDRLQTGLFSASRKLNDLTGYTSIEALKKSIEALEAHVATTRANVTQAKEAYQSAIARRSASQREVNELLQRKHAWNHTDLERFTELYRSDHANEQEEAAAHERLIESEKEADEAQTRLATSILARYHEEQIWSDKIRRASTWGTWGLMGFNVLLFIVVQLGLEPWKRKRLVGGFEEKMREVIAEENMRAVALMKEASEEAKVAVPKIEEVVEAIEEVADEEILEEAKVEEVPEVEELLEEVEEELPMDATPTQAYLHKMKVAMKPVKKVGGRAYGATKKQAEALFSAEEVVLSQRRLTTAVLEGAAAGAFVSGVVISMIFSLR